jgi:hypothetical protein
LAIKTSSAKGKGKAFQNYIRDLLFQAFPWLKEGDVGSCSMGSGGVDIPLSAVGRRTFPVSIEAKKTRKHPAAAEMRQASANAYTATVAAVVWSPHGSGPDNSMITFNLTEFLDWYKEVAEGRLAKIANEESEKI